MLCRVKPRSETANAEQFFFVGDKIAEGVLLCLEELLLRCAITSKTQVLSHSHLVKLKGLHKIV